MKKAIDLNCRMCATELTYKRVEYNHALYFCKNLECSIDKRKRFFTFLNFKTKEVAKELILLKVQDYSKKIGNPLREDTDIGPLVSARQLENIASQLEDALQK